MNTSGFWFFSIIFYTYLYLKTAFAKCKGCFFDGDIYHIGMAWPALGAKEQDDFKKHCGHRQGTVFSSCQTMPQKLLKGKPT